MFTAEFWSYVHIRSVFQSGVFPNGEEEGRKKAVDIIFECQLTEGLFAEWTAVLLGRTLLLRVDGSAETLSKESWVALTSLLMWSRDKLPACGDDEVCPDGSALPCVANASQVEENNISLNSTKTKLYTNITKLVYLIKLIITKVHFSFSVHCEIWYKIIFWNCVKSQISKSLLLRRCFPHSLSTVSYSAIVPIFESEGKTSLNFGWVCLFLLC